MIRARSFCVRTGTRPSSEACSVWMRRSARSCVAIALLGFGGAGCGSAARAGPEPEVSLADSAEAQSRFRALREQWQSSPLDARVGLERPLTDFVQRYPTDPQGRWVRIYLAWISLQRGELDVAERWLALAEPGAAGAASDLRHVVGASLELARGHADAAYRTLLALSATLIDVDDRLLCLDQLVVAAQASGRHREATAHMLELAAQAARRHRERMWRTLEPRLAKIPLSVLEESLSKLSQSSIQSSSVRPAERAAAVDWMRRQILDLLARSAITKQDVELAQRLVATPRAADRDDADKSELLLLATRGAVTPTVAGRTLGLALQLGDASLTQRSIDVASGIALTLDLADSERSAGQIVLSTRHVENGNVGEALARLAGDGATLLVAGLDPDGARKAADFAELRGVPVLLLHEPAGDRAELPASAYLLGTNEASANELLYATLERRAPSVVRWGSAHGPCLRDDPSTRSLLGSAPRDGRRRGLSFEGDAGCARDLLMSLSGATSSWVLGFGLNALGALGEGLVADEVWAVSAGRLPSFEGPRDAQLSQWVTRKGRVPTWYESLGHDAARVADVGIGQGPSEPVSDPKLVRALHRRVRGAVESAVLPDLWTSDADRFDPARRLPRELRVSKVTPSAVKVAK